MSLIYFPSCKYTAHSPETSAKIQRYLSENHGACITGCCGPNHDTLKEQDTAVYICNTCGAILHEDAAQSKSISIWEILEQDTHFPWPDYYGEKITVQDCWRVYDNRPQQNAIRKILKRINIEAIEIADCFDKADFCGISLLQPAPLHCSKFAPIRFVENAQDKFIPHTKEEQKKLMQEHCVQFTTDKTVCYCIACLTGLNLGGANGVHLMDLITVNL